MRDVNAIHGTAESTATALARMLQQLFAAGKLEDVRRAGAHGAHVLSLYDTLTLREFVQGGALRATLRHGAPLDHEAKAIERHFRRLALSTGRTVTTLDLFDDAEVEALTASYRRRQGLCVVRPLRAFGTPVGVICMHYAGRATLLDAEFDSLRRFCESTAIALYNAHIRVTLHELAYTDPLTGLPNRRRLEDELEKLRGTEASIVLIDVDGLKQVNDTLSYERGDALISMIGAALREHTKDGELAGRFGGDEFVLLLPDTHARRARFRADDLVRVLDSLEVPDDIRPYFRGASIGSATADLGDDLRDVFRLATMEMRGRKRRRKSDFGVRSRE